tara:strand:- start:324 stop:1313 length:990 start_codon:yes stop_codon:yes gene_type:complete
MINVALIGLGRIGLMHAKNISDNMHLNLFSIYETNKILLNKARKLFKCNISKNYLDLFLDPAIDVIFIASSTSTHIKYIDLGLKFKKTIFCEKPLDLNIKKIKKLFKKVNKRSKIQLGFNRRYDPGHYSLKKRLDSNKIGKLEKIIITSRDPSPPSIDYLKSSGGIFRDMMIHDFDLCRFYLKNDKIIQLNSQASAFKEFYKKINDYEIATVSMKSKNGVLCLINNSRHCSFGYDQRVELFGSKGMIISDNKYENNSKLFTSNNTSVKNNFMHFFIDRYNEAYKIQLDDLIKLHKKNSKPRSSFFDGYEALKLANAALSSLNKKRTIYL